MLAEVTAAEAPEDHHIVSIVDAVDDDATSGAIEAGDDAAGAHFRTLDEFAAADGTGDEAYVEGMAELREAALAALGRA